MATEIEIAYSSSREIVEPKKNKLTTQQHVNTIRNPWIAPAVPTTQVKRMNRITPKMF